jgi:flagellar motor switch protein FliM
MADTELIIRGAEQSTLSRGAVRAESLGMSRIEEHAAWPLLARLTVKLEAGVTLPRFKVRDLLRLEVGQVVESESPDSEDVLVKVGQVRLGWSEFEVVEQRLAIRLTRLA